ncbi:MAG TPA: outer membrane lipoprotein chaperone LolA [Gammaproteobacteria bacterium]|nr:outer membrane lipoprotein chaperone LolA [Gammaproteobacteria bacterium]
MPLSCHRSLRFPFAVVAALLLAASAAVAGDPLTDYFSTLETFHADFDQRVTDANGEEVQSSRGEVWIQRPGRFRWDYRTPYRQLIVADGRNLWTWDEDLEQASVRPLDEALGSTPAMLLSAYRPLAELMRWQRIDRGDGRQWYRLEPRQPDSSVQQLEIALRDGRLETIEVVDGFGNHTRIRFRNGQRNRSLDAGLFRLELPPGTDIIGAPS